MNYHKRRRLLGYDYATNGAYFITFCTFEKMNRFWTKDSFSPDEPIELSDYGNVMMSAIQQIPLHYPGVSVDNYVIMPNHVHLIIVLNDSNVSISNIIRKLKSYVTKTIGTPVFQHSFHDRIIRNADEYEKIWNYIEDNPRKWNEDEYYID